MRQKKTFIILVAGFLALPVAFTYLTPFVGNLVAKTRLEGYARSIGISITKKSPPLPTVTSGQIHIPVIQSSYCWGNLGCADYIGGKAMLEGVPPTSLAPEGDINVSFAYKPAPDELNIKQFLDDTTTINVPLNKGSFKAPKQKGTYYYGISAFWATDDGKFSKGDTSSVFVIEVR